MPFATWEGNALATTALITTIAAQAWTSSWSPQFTLTMACAGTAAALGADCAVTGGRCMPAYVVATGGLLVVAGGAWVAAAPTLALGRQAREWAAVAKSALLPVVSAAEAAKRNVVAVGRGATVVAHKAAGAVTGAVGAAKDAVVSAGGAVSHILSPAQ